MGTRSLTAFVEADGTEICVLYRQFDGYPEGHGQELARYLQDKKLVNGLPRDTRDLFNGMGCLAASVIAHFKDGPGGFYLYPAGSRDHGEDFTYTVYPKNGQIWLKVEEWGKQQLYDGPINEYDWED